jgi:Xaa-Pro dipeptidase
MRQETTLPYLTQPQLGTARIERLRSSMRDRGIDALLCLKPQSSYYLSGFNPIHYSHPVVAVLPVNGEPAVLVHALRDDHARASSWVKDIRLYGAWGTKATMGLDWLTALRAILDEREIAEGTLGIDDDFVPIGTMRKLQERLPGVRFEDASELIMASRMIKEPAEIEQSRNAAQISEVGMEVAIAGVAARKSEREISINAMAAMDRAWLERFPDVEVADFGSLEGGVQNGLWCHCLTGDHVTYSSDNPTLRVPVDGEIAMIVIWTNCNGLHAENERAVAVGKLDSERQRAYETMLQANADAFSAIRPGATCAEIYNVARTTYERLGYGKNLPGRIGHGLGLGGHEPPSFGPSDKVVLRPGMIMSLEPGLRTAQFSLQHSDTILVTETGAERLTHTRRGFIQV